MRLQNSTLVPQAKYTMQRFFKSPAVRRLLLIVLALCMAPPAWAGTVSVCVKGPPELKSPIIPKIRAIQTVKCSYGFDELIARITALAVDKQSVDSVETVKQVFGLPDMTAGYDHPRIADYALDMSGKGGWQLRLGVSEGFYPLNQGPARFVPGLHPKRLYKVTEATLHIDLRVAAFQSTAGAGVKCLPITAFENALKQAGWDEVQPLSSQDGELATSSFQHANKSVSINAKCSKKIPENIFLSEKPS